MTKYVIAILILVAALAGILLWVGDDVTLSVASSATSGPLSFAPLEISWQFAIVLAVAGNTGFNRLVVALSLAMAFAAAR